MSQRLGNRGFPWPQAHFLGLAPLDVWLRMLWAGRRGFRPAFALRALLALWTSLIGTVLTLPERLVLGPWLRVRLGGDRAKLREGPPVVVVLGYYRSGTTHLHYLLSADRRFVTSRWHQVAAGQGGPLSWWILRWLMIPLTPNTRPQDDVSFGPDWPAEDDFALASGWLASPLPWRFIFPSRTDLWKSWHDAGDGTPRARVRFALASFVWKMTCFARTRPVLLKSPSHTGRLSLLHEVFGDRLRVVHLAREPGAVIRSNTRMARSLSPFLMEPGPTIGEARARIVEEYERTERAFVRDAGALEGVPLVRVRYADLIADPGGEVDRIYEGLGLERTGDAQAGAQRYLSSVANYRNADARRSADESKPKSERTSEDLGEVSDAERDACAWLNETFGHAAPTREAGPAIAPAADRPRPAGWLASPLAAAVCLALWLGLAWQLGDRLDTFVWVWGVLIGLVTVHAGGRGTNRLGLWAAAWFLVAVGASVIPLPEIANGWTGRDRWLAINDAYGSFNNTYVWILLGTLSAWRAGSRAMIRPPGA
ncbi:MAG: sulfotransferase [Planctomycetota bacterium]